MIFLLLQPVFGTVKLDRLFSIHNRAAGISGWQQTLIERASSTDNGRDISRAGEAKRPISM